MITNNEILNLALVIRLINPAFGPEKNIMPDIISVIYTSDYAEVTFLGCPTMYHRWGAPPQC